LVRLSEQRDGSVALSVADSGIGISEQDIDRVMQPFAQVESSLARKHAGTGLGLPLAKAFMGLHGGRFELTSQVGTGTTATMYFPAERVLRGTVGAAS
jgi:two-component system cell cycle sensor histidine kinase PleC